MNKFGDKNFGKDDEPIAKSEAITIASQFPRSKWEGKGALIALSGARIAQFGASAEEQVAAYDKSAEENKSFVKSLEKIVRQLAESSRDALNLIERARSHGFHTLDLSGLGLTNLPAEIGDLPNLRHLNLRNNYLTRLPESISQLNNLQFLDLSNNQLSNLPKSINRLRSLEYLNLNDNYFWSLPESISQLQQLQTLALKNNPLPALPDSYITLKHLQRVESSSDELTKLLDSFLQLSFPDRLAKLDSLISRLQLFRSRLASEESGRHLTADGPPPPPPPNDIHRPRDIKEVKLILTGRSGSGKTSIVKRLTGEPFDSFQQETVGLEITPRVIPINNEDVRLNIWDFGGQEFFWPAIPIFFTHNSIYLVVLSGREGLQNADAQHWLNLIERYGGESPVIVVLNKFKHRSFDITSKELRKRYPTIRAFIETDCADDTNIDELCKAIAQETAALIRQGRDFPEDWRQIKNRLNAMRSINEDKSYLSLNEYQSLCNPSGKREIVNHKEFAKYMHEMGVLHNFIEDPRLQDTLVLHPEWLAGIIYKLFNYVNLTKDHKGEVKLSDLSDIFTEIELPSSRHVFIFDLLKKFDLCFTITDSDERYLIAHLLDAQEPMEAAEFNPTECLNFEYHYPELQPNLLSRYIVKAYQMMNGELCWRAGMVVQFEGCKAVVKGDGKKVSIHVKGPTASRRRLLAAIRSDFERIHLDFGKAESLEMVPLPKYPGEAVLYKKLVAYEQRGDEHFTEFVGGSLIELSVKELLIGMEGEGTRKNVRDPDPGKKRPRLFISYSHKDEDKREELGIHLKLMQRGEKIETWHDRLILGGDNWKDTIDDELEKADIVLLLVSVDFLASDYCYEIEMTRALERHTIGKTRVVPVIVRDVSWSQAPFAHLQVLPKDGLPVTKWPDKDTAWRNVSEGIEKVVNEICENRGWA